MIANAGLISFYGTQRTAESRVTRLRTEVFKNDREFLVETGLDWQVGDRIAIAPTSYNHDQSEDFFVTMYNSETGAVEIEGQKFKYHHYGAEESVAENYNGVDVRAEVILLSRNIKVQGIMERFRQRGILTEEPWGGRVLTGDSMEFFNEEIVIR